MLVGGSLGNLIDRLARGAVTDFLDFSRWPAFNIADMGITIGAVLIIVGLMQDGEEDEEPD
jgi:signal peptidase II